MSQQSSLGSLATIIIDKIMNFNALKLKKAGIQSKQLPFSVLSLLQSVQHKKPSKKMPKKRLLSYFSTLGRDTDCM